MSDSPIPTGTTAGQAARRAEREAAPWIEKLARLGYGAKGLVYLLVGGLAAAAAFTGGGQTTGSSGALSAVADESWGRILLGIIAAGLVGYVIWQFLIAVRNPENRGAGRRAFAALTGLVYGGLALEAGRLALRGAGGGGGDNGPEHWSARLMAEPFGPWLVAGLGVLVALYGLQQLIHAWRVELDERLDLSAMAASARTWTVRVGRFGLAARGVVLVIIGGFFVLAGVRTDPSEAGGVGDVLGAMQGTPWLLGVVALGLMAYGIYNLVRARYRVIRPV